MSSVWPACSCPWFCESTEEEVNKFVLWKDISWSYKEIVYPYKMHSSFRPGGRLNMWSSAADTSRDLEQIFGVSSWFLAHFLGGGKKKMLSVLLGHFIWLVRKIVTRNQFQHIPSSSAGV